MNVTFFSLAGNLLLVGINWSRKLVGSTGPAQRPIISLARIRLMTSDLWMTELCAKAPCVFGLRGEGFFERVSFPLVPATRVEDEAAPVDIGPRRGKKGRRERLESRTRNNCPDYI